MHAILRALAIAALLALALPGSTAEPSKLPISRVHKVVFELAADGAEKWMATLRNLENVQESLGTKATTIELVAHGKGIGLLLVRTAAANPEMKTALQKLHESGVVFAVCENTMKKQGITRKELLPLATTVDSGVGEVIRKQELGYVYIKSGG